MVFQNISFFQMVFQNIKLHQILNEYLFNRILNQFNKIIKINSMKFLLIFMIQHYILQLKIATLKLSKDY